MSSTPHPTYLKLLAASLALAAAPACILAGTTGQLQSDPVQPGQAPQGQLDVDRDAMTVGTAIDLRYVRLVSSIELLNTETHLTNTQNNPLTDSTKDYNERRFFRLDVPLLSLWDLRDGGVAYPGLLVHRHSVDLWARGGVVSIDDTVEGFYGGALTWYKTGLVAVSLTVDYWNQSAQAQALNEFGSLTPYRADASGFVFGIELTLAAGEYALDFIKYLADYDDKVRKEFPARSAARPVLEPWTPAADLP